MANSYRPANRDGFKVAIMCALTVETDAVVAFFNEVWRGDDSYGKMANDSNTYKTGRIGNLPVVLVYLPNMGEVASANVAANLQISFPRIKLCLVVGICGGAPNNGQKEILLGDVIISGALIESAFGRQYSDNIQRRTGLEDALPRPSIAIRNFLKQYAGMGMRDLIDATCIQLDELLGKSGFEGSKYPGPNEDKLFQSNYRHKHHARSNTSDCEICSNCHDWHHPVCEKAIQSDCNVLRCDDKMQITRTRLQNIKNILATQAPPTSRLEAIKNYEPEIHIGRFASANFVMKSSRHRDDLAERDKAIAFEMEGAGVWETVPTIVIKAVCDYADSHKSKVWQPYAAAVAASCMRAILREWECANIEQRRQADSEAPNIVAVSQHGINRYFEVPLDTNKNYVERKEISEKLDTLFANRERNGITESRRVVLCGLSGSGKTEIAVRFAQSRRKDYFAVFWINAVDETRLQGDFGRAGKTLGSKDDAPNPYSYTVKWLGDNSNWLLVIDNLNDESMVDLLRDEYINTSMKGDILITSNNLLAADQWDLVEVSDMRPYESGALVKNIVGSNIDLSEGSEISELLNDLGHLPIAVDQAACYMRKTRMSAADYRRLFAVKKCNMLRSRLSTQYNRKHGSDRNQGVLPTWDISFNEITRSHPEAATLFLMMSLLYHDEIPVRILESAAQAQRYWTPVGEFKECPEIESYILEDLVETLSDECLLWEAISTLTNFSFLRYKSAPSAPKSFWMHPLVHFWASQKLEADPKRPSMVKCIARLISGCFEKEDLLPPLFAGTHTERGVEERSLSLWPWRQYPTLAPHALLCLQHVNNLDSISEQVAYSSLPLLQVLEYSSLGSLEKDRGVSERLIERLRGLRTSDLNETASDQYLDFCVALWSLHRREACGCRKTIRDGVANDSPDDIVCGSCRSCFEAAEPLLNHNATTARAMTMRRALRSRREFDGIWETSMRHSEDRPSTNHWWSARPLLFQLLSPDDYELLRWTESRLMAESLSSLTDSSIEYEDTGVEHRSFVSLGAISMPLNSSEKKPFVAPMASPLPRSRLSSIERYQDACGLYLEVRSKWESGIAGDKKGFALKFRNEMEAHRDFMVKLSQEAKVVADTFETVCGLASEEYRRISFYRTSIMKGQWESVEQILAPLVEATIQDPIHSWSHERCIIRYTEALIEQGKIEVAKQVLSRAESAYQKTGRQFRSIEKNVLLLNTLKNVEEEFQIFVVVLTGRHLTINVRASSSVRSVMDALFEKDGLPVQSQRLIYGGKQLDQDRLLSDYNIQKEATIHLVLRLYGGVKLSLRHR